MSAGYSRLAGDDCLCYPSSTSQAATEHKQLQTNLDNCSAGNVAPLAVGVSLVLDLFAAAAYSGGGVSPARVLGPAIVFHCHWNTAWVYMLGGTVLAHACFGPSMLRRASYTNPMHKFHAQIPCTIV